MTKPGVGCRSGTVCSGDWILALLKVMPDFAINCFQVIAWTKDLRCMIVAF